MAATFPPERIVCLTEETVETMRSDNLPGPMSAHLARSHAARLMESANPFDHRAHADLKSGRSLSAGQAVRFDGGNDAFAKIGRKRLRHPCWAPSPASTANQI